MLRRGASALASVTATCASPRSVASYGITVVPAGAGAPVMMRTASPGASAPAKASPACTAPTTR